MHRSGSKAHFKCQEVLILLLTDEKCKFHVPVSAPMINYLHNNHLTFTVGNSGVQRSGDARATA